MSLDSQFESPVHILPAYLLKGSGRRIFQLVSGGKPVAVIDGDELKREIERNGSSSRVSIEGISLLGVFRCETEEDILSKEPLQYTGVYSKTLIRRAFADAGADTNERVVVPVTLFGRDQGDDPNIVLARTIPDHLIVVTKPSSDGPTRRRRLPNEGWTIPSACPLV